MDDGTDLLWLMSNALRRKGSDVETFSHAPTMEEVRKMHPAVVFLDVETGKENGEEVCAMIKGKDGAVGIPVILISSYANERSRETARRCGADDRMTKSFDVSRIASLATRYVNADHAA